jgi:hypothetical protein
MHQASSLDFARWIIWELFRDGNITIEILDKNFEITVKLEKWKASLCNQSAISIARTES